MTTHDRKPSVDPAVRARLRRGRRLNRWADGLRAALAVLLVAGGWVAWGPRGAALAVTLIVFVLLLQFNRAVRVLRLAAARPPGSVDSAVMLHARLRPGLRLPAVLRLTGSLGRKVADDPEAWAWADAGGDAVHVELHAGRVARWELQRAASAANAGADEPARAHPAA